MSPRATSPTMARRPCSISVPGLKGPNAPFVAGSDVYCLACRPGMKEARAMRVEANTSANTWSCSCVCSVSPPARARCHHTQVWLEDQFRGIMLGEVALALKARGHQTEAISEITDSVVSL